MVQPGENLELYTQRSLVQVESMATPFPEFEALVTVPASLGNAAHERLEEIFNTPIASDDSQPDVSDAVIGQRAGIPFGDRLGREKEFTKNLPEISNNVTALAEERDVSVGEVWAGIQDILVGSGIGQPMHRTLSKPLGGEQGAREYIADHASEGVSIILRENIANWGFRRQQQLLGLLGSLPLEATQKVENIIYAGSGRPIRGIELWRPELRPYVTGTNDESVEQSSLTEASTATELHIPETERLLTALDASERTKVYGVDAGTGASGDDVMRAVAEEHGDALRDTLIVEVGNAPAGFTQLMGGLVLAHELDIDPTVQYVAVSDGVTLVRPDHFEALSLEQKSKVQNTTTALNSFNGWLKAVVATNAFVLKQGS